MHLLDFPFNCEGLIPVCLPERATSPESVLIPLYLYKETQIIYIIDLQIIASKQ